MSIDFVRLDPESSQGKFTSQLIAKLRTRLLDLTNRNPLLNYRHSDRARAQVRAVDASPNFVYSRLSEGKELSFCALEEPPGELGDEQTDEFQMALEAARLVDSEYLDGVSKVEGDDPNNPVFLKLERLLKDRVRTLGLPVRLNLANISPAECARIQGIKPSYDLTSSDSQDDGDVNEIQTLLFPDRMEARLSSLREGARRALEEQGINTLFAAYGFLEWYEAPQSETPLYAPLLLQPLEIDRVSQRGKWRYFVKATEKTQPITSLSRKD